MQTLTLSNQKQAKTKDTTAQKLLKVPPNIHLCPRVYKKVCITIIVELEIKSYD